MPRLQRCIAWRFVSAGPNALAGDLPNENVLFPSWEHDIRSYMRVIAKSTLVAFGSRHPEAWSAIERWHSVIRNGARRSPVDLQSAFSSAAVLNGERVRFEIAVGNYRLIAAFDFRRQIAFVKFLGTHAEYDKIDALTVSQF